MRKHEIRPTKYGSIRLAYKCMDCGCIIDPDEEICYYDDETKELRCDLCFASNANLYEQDCRSNGENLPEEALSEVFDDTDV